MPIHDAEWNIHAVGEFLSNSQPFLTNAADASCRRAAQIRKVRAQRRSTDSSRRSNFRGGLFFRVWLREQCEYSAERRAGSAVQLLALALPSRSEHKLLMSQMVKLPVTPNVAGDISQVTPGNP